MLHCDITSDPIGNLVNNILNKLEIYVHHKIIQAILYNLIPAYIFAPIFIYKGMKYNNNIFIFIGIAVMIIDSIHFVINVKNSLK